MLIRRYPRKSPLISLEKTLFHSSERFVSRKRHYSTHEQEQKQEQQVETSDNVHPEDDQAGQKGGWDFLYENTGSRSIRPAVKKPATLRPQKQRLTVHEAEQFRKLFDSMFVKMKSEESNNEPKSTLSESSVEDSKSNVKSMKVLIDEMFDKLTTPSKLQSVERDPGLDLLFNKIHKPKAQNLENRRKLEGEAVRKAIRNSPLTTGHSKLFYQVGVPETLEQIAQSVVEEKEVVDDHVPKDVKRLSDVIRSMTTSEALIRWIKKNLTPLILDPKKPIDPVYKMMVGSRRSRSDSELNSLPRLPNSILPKIYPDIVLLLIRHFRYQLNDARAAAALFELVSHGAGLESHVVACTPKLYMEMLRIAWHGDWEGIATGTAKQKTITEYTGRQPLNLNLVAKVLHQILGTNVEWSSRIWKTLKAICNDAKDEIRTAKESMADFESLSKSNKELDVKLEKGDDHSEMPDKSKWDDDAIELLESLKKLVVPDAPNFNEAKRKKEREQKLKEIRGRGRSRDSEQGFERERRHDRSRDSEQGFERERRHDRGQGRGRGRGQGRGRGRGRGRDRDRGHDRGRDQGHDRGDQDYDSGRGYDGGDQGHYSGRGHDRGRYQGEDSARSRGVQNQERGSREWQAEEWLSRDEEWDSPPEPSRAMDSKS